MKKAFSAFLAVALSALPLASIGADKETNRLENCGTVLEEVLRIPDNIPQDLLDKAECVIVIPSVLKAAFVFRRRLRTRRHDLPLRRTLHG